MSDERSVRNPQPRDATPEDVSVPSIPSSPAEFGLHDSGWSDAQWIELLKQLIDAGIGTWKDVAALVLGHLNPSQVGTSLASSAGFKRRYGKGHTMRLVMAWVHSQTGQCADCGSRLELQADHIRGKEQFANPLDADFIENMTLRCRRCNVIRRPSHKFGGLTFLTAESALMWILLVIRPRILLDYVRMCRLYGMTMSDIRMEEAWAMAHWLAGSTPPAFEIEDDAAEQYDLLLWPDGAITRTDAGLRMAPGATLLASSVPGTSSLAFIVADDSNRPKLYEHPVPFIPFSTYDLGARPPQALAIRYSPPGRKESGKAQRLHALAPRGMRLMCHTLKHAGQKLQLLGESESVPGIDLPDTLTRGRLLRIQVPAEKCRLVAVSV